MRAMNYQGMMEKTRNTVPVNRGGGGICLLARARPFREMGARQWLTAWMGVLALALVLFHSDRTLALVAPATISSDTTWTALDSPVSITNSCVVASNATLTIEPGVTVNVAGSIKINGQLHALGSADNRIIFNELNPGEKWGNLYFDKGPSVIPKTNQLVYTTFTNLNSYIYISEQTAVFSNCAIHIRGDLYSYGLCTYVNTSVTYLVGTRLVMVSNIVDITSTRDNPNSAFNFVILDGFNSEFIGNTFTFTITGRWTEVKGFKLYVSNTRPFQSHFIGNTITLNTVTNHELLNTYGLCFDPDVDGIISNNTITVSGPESVYGIKKYYVLPVANNTIHVASTAVGGSSGYMYGVCYEAASAGTNDLIVNNRIHLATDLDSRFLYGILCEAGLVRGNRIIIRHHGASGTAQGICQEYYPGYLEGNTVAVAAQPGVQARGIYLATHYNTAAVVRVFNNLVQGTNINQSIGIYKDVDCAASISNGYNLVYDFETNFVGCSSGPGDLTSAPLLADTNLHLSANSPARDAGTNLAWTFNATDLDGWPRIENDRVDIGAYEFTTNCINVAMYSAVENPTRTSSIPVTVIFSGPVTGFTNTDIVTGNGYVTNFQEVETTNFTFALIPTNPGAVTAAIPAGVAQGLNDTANGAAVPFSRVYDIAGPTGVVVSMSGSPTNAATIEYFIVFNEVVTGFESNDITLTVSGTATGAPPVLNGSGSNYTVTVNNVNGDGWLGICVEAGVCCDLAGNSNDTLPAVSNQIDTTRPTCLITRNGETPTNASEVSFTLSFDTVVNGLTLDGIVLTNTDGATGTLADLGGAGATYAVSVVGLAGDGEIGICLPASNAWDAAGNGNEPGARVAYTIDRTCPTCLIQRAQSSPAQATTVGFTIIFSENVHGFSTEDVVLHTSGTAGHLDVLSGSGSYYSINAINISGNGTLGISIAAGQAWDDLGNGNQAGAQSDYAIDQAAPVFTLSSASSATTGVSPIPVTVTISEPVTGFAFEDITPLHATVVDFIQLSELTYAFALAPEIVGEVGADIHSGTACDAAGNNNATAQFRRIYSLSPPAGLSASDGTYPEKVRVMWSAISSAAGYRLYRHTADQPDAAELLGSAMVPEYADISATPGQIYYYWVQAIYAGSTSIFSSSETGYRAMSAPTGLSASDGACREKVQLGWSASAGASSYVIYRHHSDDFNAAERVGETTALLFEDTAAIPGLIYYYWVRAGHAAVFSHASECDPGWCLTPCNTIANCDFDGDAKADPALYVEATGSWYIKLSGSEYAQLALEAYLGGPGYSPASADYDGDGKADPVVYQELNGRWFGLLSAFHYAGFMMDRVFGGAGYSPIAADYDGDRKSDPMVYYQALGDWFVLLSANGYEPLNGYEFLGGPGYVPASADYDGDQRADPAIYREITGDWIIRLSGSDYDQVELKCCLGGPGYRPVPGDYDGDGLADPAVCHFSNGEWHFLLSGSGYALFSTQWMQRGNTDNKGTRPK